MPAKKIKKKKLDLKKFTKKGKPRQRGQQPERVSAVQGIPIADKEVWKKETSPWWREKSTAGVDKIFGSPEIMWQAACEYFKWCDANPLYKVRTFHSEGCITQAKEPVIRAYTWQGLCLYLGVSSSYFREFKSALRIDKERFMAVIKQIEDTLHTQKFEAAAGDLLNANIISRDLGLIDKSSVDVKDDRKSTADLFPFEDDKLKKR